MNYYFSRIHKSDLGTYSKSTQLKYIKERASTYLGGYRDKIRQITGLSTEPYWVSISTFGAILCDFSPEKTGPSIVGCHKALFELISDDYDLCMLSHNLKRNHKEFVISGKKLLVINIERYKKFTENFSNGRKRAKLFLFKNLTTDEETIINNWIETKPSSEFPKQLSTEDAIDILATESADGIGKNIERLDCIREANVLANLTDFEQELNKFESMVHSGSHSETQLRQELFSRLWIIDFSFSSNHFEKAQEYHTDSGNVDIWISKKRLTIKKDILIELKLPNKLLTTKYRKKEAVRAEIGKALSQLIHYLEATKKPYTLQSGLIIIGKESDKQFIDLFNSYLHGIEIKTYQQLIDRCREIINKFKSVDTPQTKSET